ncbi:S8 family serine peptidase [Litchfieldia salsa]|uniref:S8 family serine peptidase n=1 Tax=Litchfieldia salsa TaxID=930152 RepID=UPI002367586B|nr:S8 family serine peptidase [Litchfieldia salsa]
MRQTSIKIISIFLLLVSIYVPVNAETPVFPNRPELPEESLDEIITSVIVAEENNRNRIATLIRNNPSLEITQEYKHVFHGFSVKGKRSEIEKLREEEGIIHSSPVALYKASLDQSVPFIGGDAIRGYFDEKNDRLTGKGIKVGVIDTGIDYNHPDLKSNYHGGFDIVDGDNDPMETKGSSRDQTLHGTHVAGIIAANGKLKGVAPEAEVIAYRALGPGGIGTSDQVIAAIDKAIEDKVDIINLSLGNNVNGPDWPTSLALNKATEEGIIAVTSSGNSGPDVWTVGSPGTATKAISVGASTPPLKVPSITIGIEDKEIDMMEMQGSKPWFLKKQYSLVSAGLGDKSDFKQNVRDKIVLLKRGTITFTEKALNAQVAGAKGVLIYNNVKGDFAGALEIQLDIPVASISKEEGEWLKKQLKKKNTMIKTTYHDVRDTIASFSSRGPVTNTWEIKPDVVAPGVAINSTIPKGYTELQGTSMAAPHVAGAAALIKQAHPNWTPEQVKASLMNTAKLLTDENNELYEPYEQGAGRIQVIEAINANTLVYPSTLTFGMFQHKDNRTKKEITITVDNQSDKETVYSFDIPKHKEGFQWKLPTPFTLKPNEKRKIKISVDLTPSVIGAGLHSGHLFLNEGKGRKTHIPYMIVIEEPDYPRVMAFQFGAKEEKSVFQYQLYLPRGAEEYGIALYDPDSLRFITFLDWKRDVPRGLIEKEISAEKLGLKGIYKAIIFAKKAGKEDTIEADLLIDEIGAN